MEDSQAPYERFARFYEDDGRIPWDSPEPPPEVISLAQTLSPGRALDLGCGYGRTAIYLAERGWVVDAVDFVPKAIHEARARAEQAGVSDSARFHVASAAHLPFLHPPYHLAVDIGCMHSFDELTLAAYERELARLLISDAIYLLFVHLRDVATESEDDGPQGIAEEWIHRLMAENFTLEWTEYGVTQVADRPPWNSGWFRYRRRA